MLSLNNKSTLAALCAADENSSHIGIAVLCKCYLDVQSPKSKSKLKLNEYFKASSDLLRSRLLPENEKKK